ncbi:MAG: sugar kinase [Actinomycetota bacterium]|nr:sugar kinase [Actinomycetota bacterium]
MGEGIPGQVAVGLGEAMIRLTVPGRQRLAGAASLEVSVGGAELNLLVALAQLGVASRWVTRLPDGPLGDVIRRHAMRFGVDVRAEMEAPGRAGLYFVELGALPRAAEVTYDRADSAASHLRAGSFDWSSVLSDAAVFHTTGITCALGSQSYQAVQEAIGVARELGVVVSFDCNFRRRLWEPDVAALRLREVVPHVDVLFASAFDLGLILGRSGDLLSMATEVQASFGVGTVVVRSQRELGGESLELTVVVVEGSQQAKAVAVTHVVDPFGAGDAAAAAFLAARLREHDSKTCANWAVMASACQYTLPGDTWLVRPADLLTGHSSARIDR